MRLVGCARRTGQIPEIMREEHREQHKCDQDNGRYAGLESNQNQESSQQIDGGYQIRNDCGREQAPRIARKLHYGSVADVVPDISELNEPEHDENNSQTNTSNRRQVTSVIPHRVPLAPKAENIFFLYAVTFKPKGTPAIKNDKNFMPWSARGEIAVTKRSRLSIITSRIYVEVETALWASLAAFVIFFCAFIAPDMPKHIESAQRQRQLDIVVENNTFCSKWGKQEGSQEHLSCVIDLQELRANIAKRHAEETMF
jgi:hypothetical protein